MIVHPNRSAHNVSRFLGWTALAAAVYAARVRPWYMHWGATEDEIDESLPGDELIPDALGRATRAITIDAPPPAVWPWIVQMGYKRGGFYSYDALENITVRMAKVPIKYQSATQIVPELQHLKVGDPVPITPVGGDLTVKELQPERALVLGMDDKVSGAYTLVDEEKSTYLALTWAYVLKDLGDNRTRLIIRSRADYKPRTLNRFSTYLTYYPEPFHFVMERKTLLSIKARAEQAWISRPAPVFTPHKADGNGYKEANELQDLVAGM